MPLAAAADGDPLAEWIAMENGRPNIRLNFTDAAVTVNGHCTWLLSGQATRRPALVINTKQQSFADRRQRATLEY